jgi:CDP-diacylglycerol--serine O-phosphatidyltransferase
VMTIKKHIPNALTCCNLLCGCFGILVTIYNKLDLAFYLVLIAAVFDFLDGFAARMLKVSSPIGKDLDSLADMVTFGVLPGFIMYKMIGSEYSLSAISPLLTSPVPGWHTTVFPYSLFISFIAFIIPVFSALRLAKFNNDTRQSDSFIGVNTPANTLLISSLGYIFVTVLNSEEGPGNFFDLLYNTYTLVGLTLLMSFLLVSELPIFALKFKNFGWTDNKIRYVFLIIAVILLILFQFYAFPFIIFLYILLSIINNIITKKEKINS